MTAQVPDEFRYEGEMYSLVGLDGEGLFIAEEFGLKLVAASTACWRGHVMKYDCIDGELVLSGIDIRTQEEPPIINNTEARSLENESGYSMFSHSYENLNLKTSFTGSMLLAKDFIESMYVHLGFQRPMAFRTVLEIQVQDGDIISVSDLSEKMEDLRERNGSKGAQPVSDSDEDVRSWIEDTFSLDYDIE